MDNENVKEILDNPKILMLSYGNYISLDDYVKLKDYITNLQTIEQQYSAILSENAELENKITNLQEENEHLITQLNTYENTIKEVNKECNSLFNHLTKKDLDYKSRNEKAIEYINNNLLYSEDYDYDEEDNLVFTGARCDSQREDLLNILQGEDKE